MRCKYLDALSLKLVPVFHPQLRSSKLKFEWNPYFTEYLPLARELKINVEKSDKPSASSLTRYSYLKSVNAEYIDEMYSRYLENADSVEDSWKFFFEGIEFGAENFSGATAGAGDLAILSVEQLEGEGKVAKLIQAYRESGINIADINPLEAPASSHAFLDLSRFGLTPNDLDKSFNSGKLLGLGTAKLRDIITVLKETYCSTIGVEFIHIHNPE